MRFYQGAICFLGFLLAGCSTTPPTTEQSAKRAAVATASTNTTAVVDPRGRPTDALSGRVVTVNPSLRFVIVEFYHQRLPQLDQRLSVYRLDQKVAEIKISGPYRGSTVAADVTAGEAKFGDLVREN